MTSNSGLPKLINDHIDPVPAVGLPWRRRRSLAGHRQSDRGVPPRRALFVAAVFSTRVDLVERVSTVGRRRFAGGDWRVGRGYRKVSSCFSAVSDGANKKAPPVGAIHDVWPSRIWGGTSKKRWAVCGLGSWPMRNPAATVVRGGRVIDPFGGDGPELGLDARLVGQERQAPAVGRGMRFALLIGRSEWHSTA